MRGCGRIARPAFPAPSDVSGRNVHASLGRIRAAGRRRRVCCLKIESEPAPAMLKELAMGCKACSIFRNLHVFRLTQEQFAGSAPFQDQSNELARMTETCLITRRRV